MANSDALGSAFLDVRTPVKLPDALRGEKYGECNHRDTFPANLQCKLLTLF